MRNGEVARFVSDSCDDFPKSLIGKRVRVLSRRKDHDEYNAYGELIKAYNAQFLHHKNRRVVVYEDELA